MIKVQAYKHDSVINAILGQEQKMNLKWDGQLGTVAFDKMRVPFQTFTGKGKVLALVPPYWTIDFLFAWQKKMGCSSFKHTYFQDQPCALTTQRISNSLRVTFLPIFQGHHSPRTTEKSVTFFRNMVSPSSQD